MAQAAICRNHNDPCQRIATRQYQQQFGRAALLRGLTTSRSSLPGKVIQLMSEQHFKNSPRFIEAIRRFDEENSRDPNSEIVNGVSQPRELVYARLLMDWVLKLEPNASEALQLAARCQHLCRWTIPRDSYPMTRPGYLQWREALKKFHAQKAGEILREAGYGDDVMARVQSLNLKKNFPTDPESRVLEDALCLVFLQYQFADLANKTGRDKMIAVLQKSWKKMTPQAREAALKLEYAPREKELLGAALQI